MNQKLFSKDFTLVVIGQIISLFGNAAVRFALPLYLLNLTGSSALYGAVTACAFIPAILLSPIGGILADRVNKRNIMVILDFFTAGVILTFSLLQDGAGLVLLLTVTLMLLYGIASAYQPSVQASIPALVCQEQFIAANSVINIISSFASLLGPVLGGILYSAYGLGPVLWACTSCFILSAVMELFIEIPFQKQNSDGTILNTVKKDFTESIRFIVKSKPVIGKVLLTVCGINLFLSSMITVALPYLVTEVLPFNPLMANRLYGFAEGALAAGGLAGGICAGIFAKKLSVQKSGSLITACVICVFPMAAALIFFSSGVLNYSIITICCFGVMFFSTIFTVQILSFVQAETPQNLIGKVIALCLTVSMCAQPLGNALYGLLFEICKGFEYAVILFSGTLSLAISVSMKNIFRKFLDKSIH
ncbi:MFS transporter [Parablautia intestinalis]|uniref:MFS transporter n=1 Tax=Parablautia intestinalis TaxID=2320100 RepID=A0A3A9AQL0_9FIRM|nr:MFS transporter [Parablautia intestinalis]MCI8615626.1 MFS transporter [Lachnospiraceae bacterium]MDE7048123.1 MFS transporter [Lachnospiraceae bacterium]RKI93519.1 MFS transporter [Parablautia intestinalis]